MSKPILRRIATITGRVALVLAALSSLVALTVRDAVIPTEIVFFGIPWLIRLLLLIAGWVLARPLSRKWRVLYLIVITHTMIQAVHSFSWRSDPPAQSGSFDVILWNAGRNLWNMPREWPRLAGAKTKLVVLIEAGPLAGETWKRFTAANPSFAWKHLDGGIVVGVKGKMIDVTPLGDRPRFRCHRIRVEIDGEEYTVVAVDIPSQPWQPKDHYLKRILDVSPPKHCMILGDFNTPPEALGFDAWRERFSLANDGPRRGFRETWCYGLPALTLDQLWLARDMAAVNASQTATLRSDHVRMNFRVTCLHRNPR